MLNKFLVALLMVLSAWGSQAQSILLNTKASSSAFSTSAKANYANDGSLDSAWNSGGYAPAWIQFEVPSNHPPIGNIRLVPAQTPSGDTSHSISVQHQDGRWEEVANINRATIDKQAIDVPFAVPLVNLKQIKVSTNKSPSWVAWYEILAFAADTGTGAVSNNKDAVLQTTVSNVDATAGPQTLSSSRVSVGTGRCTTARTKVEQRDGDLLVELERPYNCSFKVLIAKVAGQTLPIIDSRGGIRKGASDYYYWPGGISSGYVVFKPSRAITPAEAESLTFIQADCVGECLSSLSEIKKPFDARYKELQSAPGKSRFKFNPPDGIESDSNFFDRVSGNTWRRCDLGKKYSATERKCVGDSITASWPEAVAIVQKLNEKNFEGANNWRLPTGVDLASLLLNEPDFWEIRSMRHYKYGFAADDWFADYGEKTEVNYGGYYGGYRDRGEGQCRLAAQTLATVLGGVNGIELVGRGDTAPKSHYRWLSDNYKWVSGQKLSRESNDWQNPRAIVFNFSCRNILTAFFKDNSNAQLAGLLVSHAAIPLTIVRGGDVPQEWTDAQAAVKNIDAINRQSKEAQNSRLNSAASFYNSIGSKIKDAYAAGSKASQQTNSESSAGSAEKSTSGTWKVIEKYEGGFADFGFDWRSTVYVVRCGSGAEKRIYSDKKGLWGTVGLGGNNGSSTFEDAVNKNCK